MTDRIHKYGCVPIGYPQRETIDELWHANNLWKTLLALHGKHHTIVQKLKEAGLSLPQWSGINLIAGKTTPRLLLEN
jgi:hypothetical protein